MNDVILSAEGISKSYQRGSERVHALREVDFSLKAGEFVSVVGPSGSGKSTLLHLLGLLETPSSGRIKIDGREMSGLREPGLVKTRRGSIGFISQQFLLLPTLTVRENIELPLLFSKKKARPGKIAEIMDLLGLSPRSNHLPHQLSGGEMQRVSIGRSLINEPKIIMADEPTGNLDSVTSQKIFTLFKKLNADGLSLVIVTHNAGLAAMATRVVKLRDGGIVAG